ncbi:ABC transporter permease subunit, partial [bacterium]|nr:ABC transporter permease subunit [bacterium]
RELKKTFEQQNKGNWILMPLYPFSPVENLLSEISGEPPTVPDATHILGTDNRGRDVFARLIYGFQISISFALVVTFFSFLIGIVIGALLGYYGGKVDIYGQRFIEVLSAIPFLFLMMILVSITKPSFLLLVVMLVVLTGWIPETYYLRGEYYREKAKDYVSAAVSMGANDFQVMFKHILPNALTPVIAFAPFAVVGYITVLVSLDFLGFGLAAPTPSWGELIGQGTQDIRYWWLIVSPLTAIFFTLMTITFVGEGVREAFDPKVYSRLR